MSNIEQIIFCEQYLYVEFTGDIENKEDIAEFLDAYFNEAKERCNEILIEYNTI